MSDESLDGSWRQSHAQREGVQWHCPFNPIEMARVKE